MQAATAIDTADVFKSIVADTRDFVSILQRPQVSDPEWLGRVRTVALGLIERISAFAHGLTDAQRTIREALERMLEGLKACLLELERRNAKTLRSLQLRLAQGYEELLAEYRTFTDTRTLARSRKMHLKTANYTRNIFHACMGLTAVVSYQWLLDRGQTIWILSVMLASFILLDIARRLSARLNDFLMERLFKPIARPFERYRTPGSTFYVAALLIVVVFFEKPVAELGALVLAFADPAASIVGKRWGGRKIWRDKSWVGTTAFLLTAIAVTVPFLLLAMPGIGPGRIVAVTLAVAVSGTVTEIVSTRLDDNFTIPVVCASAAALALWV